MLYAFNFLVEGTRNGELKSMGPIENSPNFSNRKTVQVGRVVQVTKGHNGVFVHLRLIAKD